MKDESIIQPKWGLNWKRPKAKKFNENWAVEEETANFLYGITKMVKPLRFLEIGTFEGTSAGAIGQAMKENGHGKIWTIDYKDYGQEGFMKELGLEEQVKCVIGELPESVINIVKEEGQQFDMAFIDDGHAFEDALRDIVSCHPVIRKYGYIMGHDVINVPDVARALDTFLAEHSKEYEKVIIASYDGLFILRKLI